MIVLARRPGYIAASWAEAIRRDHEVPARLLAQVIQTAKLGGGGVLDMDPIQSAVATYILDSTGHNLRDADLPETAQRKMEDHILSNMRTRELTRAAQTQARLRRRIRQALGS